VRGIPEGVQALLQVNDLVFHTGSFGDRVGHDVLLAALGEDAARVELIVSGNGNLWAIDPALQGSIGDFHVSRTLTGPPGFGGVTAALDLDGDGQLDLLVSASGVYPGERVGQVLLYPGPVCPAVRTADDAALVIDGEGIYDYFGRMLATTDLDADGRDDVLLTAHGAPDATGRGVIEVIPASALAW
jgi:hypothetical protein